MTGELSQLRSEMGAFVQAHRQQNETMSRLERSNPELRNRLAEAAAYAPTLPGGATPAVHPIHTPPGLGTGGGGPPGGGGDDFARVSISQSLLVDIREFKSDKPVSMITANSPNYADKQCKVRIPSMCCLIHHTFYRSDRSAWKKGLISFGGRTVDPTSETTMVVRFTWM